MHTNVHGLNSKIIITGKVTTIISDQRLNQGGNAGRKQTNHSGGWWVSDTALLVGWYETICSTARHCTSAV